MSPDRATRFPWHAAETTLLPPLFPRLQLLLAMLLLLLAGAARADTITVTSAELLAEEDVEHLAAAIEPGSTAGVIIWENLWAAPFASAARRAGGQLIANGRIPIQAIIASIEADQAPANEGD